MPSLDKNLPRLPVDLDQRTWKIDASDDHHVIRGVRMGFRVGPHTGGSVVWRLLELDQFGVPVEDGAIVDSKLTEMGGPWLHGSVDYRGHAGSTNLLVMFYGLMLPLTSSSPDCIHRVIAWSGQGFEFDAKGVVQKLTTHNGTWHGNGGGD